MINDLEFQDFNKQVLAPTEHYNFRSAHGKSTVDVLCPFCKEKTTAFVWSLSGGGKRCENCKENVLLNSINAFMRFKTVEEAKEYYENNNQIKKEIL